VSRPRLLDLYCCEGGAAVGYHRAGFDVFGVDLFDDYTQARYPFPSHKGDAIAYLQAFWFEFDAVHASPPCQRHSAGTRGQDRSKYPDLIAPTRKALQALGVPYVIENVVGAPLLDPVELCGCMFDLGAPDDDGLPLRLERPRLFESNVPLAAPREHRHDPNVWVAGSYGGARKQGSTPAERRHNARYVRKGGYVPSKEVQQRLLDIDWMTVRGMHQSIPPAYTEHIGRQLLAHIGRAAA
jgi:DNA (cytosine-5)-methyltransferase 1